MNKKLAWFTSEFSIWPFSTKIKPTQEDQCADWENTSAPTDIKVTFLLGCCWLLTSELCKVPVGILHKNISFRNALVQWLGKTEHKTLVRWALFRVQSDDSDLFLEKDCSNMTEHHWTYMVDAVDVFEDRADLKLCRRDEAVDCDSSAFGFGTLGFSGCGSAFTGELLPGVGLSERDSVTVPNVCEKKRKQAELAKQGKISTKRASWKCLEAQNLWKSDVTKPSMVLGWSFGNKRRFLSKKELK